MMSGHGISRRGFLETVGAGAAAMVLAGRAPGAEAGPARKPNVILIYADDLGWGDLGCFGAKDIATPNIDAIAAAGIRMTSQYSAAPVCSPSRSALLTGRIPKRAGIPSNVAAGWNVVGLRKEMPIIPELLKREGYATAVFGKWHQGSAPESRPNAKGFDEFFGFLHGCIGYYDHIFKWSGPLVHDLWRSGEEVHEDGKYFTDLVTREALRFISAKRDGPFFLYLPYNAPHYPMEAPKEWLDKYAGIEPNRRPYAAIVNCMDDSIGRIAARIRELGLADSTLIIFTSDNGPSDEARTKLDPAGPMPGSAGPWRGTKFTYFEGGIRMPLVAAWPGRIKPGQTSDALGIHMDLMPTIAEAAGAAAPPDIDGCSLWPVFRGGESKHEALYWDDPPVVRRGRWKLIVPRKPADGPMLFDLQADPGEQNDLAAAKPDVLAELRAMHEKWRASWQ